MSLMKCVNGVSVPMTEAEAAAISAEWERNLLAPKPAPRPTLNDLILVLKTKGVLLEGDV